MSNVPPGCMFFIARSHIAGRGVLTLAIGIAFYLDDFFFFYMTIVVGDFWQCIDFSCAASKILTIVLKTQLSSTQNIGVPSVPAQLSIVREMAFLLVHVEGAFDGGSCFLIDPMVRGGRLRILLPYFWVMGGVVGGVSSSLSSKGLSISPRGK